MVVVAAVKATVSERPERATCLEKSLKTIKGFRRYQQVSTAGDHCVPAHTRAASLAFDTTSVTTMRKFVFIFKFEPIFESQLTPQIAGSGAHGLTSAAPSPFRAHISILLTNFSPSGGFSHPRLFYYSTR